MILIGSFFVEKNWPSCHKAQTKERKNITKSERLVVNFFGEKSLGVANLHHRIPS